MATISRVQDLLPLLGAVETDDDPIASLEQRGHVLSPALKTRLKPGRVFSPAQRKLWKETAAKAGAVRITVGEQPRIAPRQLAPDEYEFSAGIRMPAANEILAGVHANGTIPEVLFLDELISPGNIDTLQRFFAVDKPGGRIGRFLITAPPTIAPIREGSNNVAFTIPFRMNFERIATAGSNQVRTVVTFATGRLRLSIRLVAETDTDSRGARNLEMRLDLSQAADARLETNANSPVKRINPPAPGQVDLLAVILQQEIQKEIQKRLGGALRLSVSATVPLPTGKLEIRSPTILTRGNAILVGLRVTPGLGNPDKLTAHFPNSQTNFFTRVHDEILRLIIQSAAKSGVLTLLAKETHPDAVIDSADVAFGKDTIQLIASGRIVDLCPGGVDVGFTVTTTLTITLDGTRIVVKKETSKDVDDGDAIFCAITTLGLALLTAVAVGIFVGFSFGVGAGIAFGIQTFGAVGFISVLLAFDDDDFALVFGSGGDDKPTIIELDFPIPGTDLLPTLTGNFIRLDESTMLMAANLGTRPDNLNTYFYVRFMEPDARSASAFVTRPIRDARVRLMDRDSP